MRRALIIGAVVIVLLGVGGFVYWRYFSNTPGLVVTGPSTTLPGTGNATSTVGGGSGETTVNPSSPVATKVTSRLTKIAAGPIVPGMAVVSVLVGSASSASTSPSTGTPDIDVRFIERQSGNIFSYLTRSGRLTRTSNKTLPGIAKARWLPSGRTTLVTYLSGDTLGAINTYGFAPDGSGGFFLPQGLVDIAVSSTSILTLSAGANGSVASLSLADGTKSAAVFTSPLSQLRIGFAGPRGYMAFTKPSQSLLGDLFLVSVSGVFTRLAGPLPGLIALPSHSGSSVLVSTSNSGVMRMMLVDTATGAQISLPLDTIADKCVWTADDSALYCGVPVSPPLDYSYPDDWYQGVVHFSDRIWRIDVKGRIAQLVLDPSSINTAGAIDAEALALDPAGTVLVFVNRNDGSLWSYQL